MLTVYFSFLLTEFPIIIVIFNDIIEELASIGMTFFIPFGRNKLNFPNYRIVNRKNNNSVIMRSAALTVEEYINQIPAERREDFSMLRKTILENIPKGFEEQMSYGMIGYVVPFSIYPKGYHCDQKLPLPFLNIAVQKNFIALYHMGIYANPTLLKWYTDEYSKISKVKLDMGKSCTRFKKGVPIPFALIGELVKKMEVADWISIYESAFRKNK